MTRILEVLERPVVDQVGDGNGRELHPTFRVYDPTRCRLALRGRKHLLVSCPALTYRTPTSQLHIHHTEMVRPGFRQSGASAAWSFESDGDERRPAACGKIRRNYRKGTGRSTYVTMSLVLLGIGKPRLVSIDTDGSEIATMGVRTSCSLLLSVVLLVDRLEKIQHLGLLVRTKLGTQKKGEPLTKWCLFSAMRLPGAVFR